MQNFEELWEKLRSACFDVNDVCSVLECVSDDIQWADTVRNIFANGKAELAASLEKYGKPSSHPEIIFEKPFVQKLGDSYINMTAKGGLAELPHNSSSPVISVSISCSKTENGWLVRSANFGATGSAACSDTHAAVTEAPYMAQLYQHIADDTAVGIAVTDVDRHELLYVNDALRDMLHIRDKNCACKKCYGYLRAGTAPCPSCAANKLSVGESCEAVVPFPQSGKYLSVKSRLIEWAGHRVLIEYDTDITKTYKEQKLTAHKYSLEKAKSRMDESGLIGHTICNLTKRVLVEFDFTAGWEYPDIQKSASFEQLVTKTSELIAAGHSRSDYLSLNDRSWLLKQFANGISEHRLEYRRKLNNGRVIWARNVLRLLREPATDDVLLFEYCYDINRQKMMESMLNDVVKADYESIASFDINRNLVMIFSGQRYAEYCGSLLKLNDVTDSYAKEEVAEEDRKRYLSIFSSEKIRSRLSGQDVCEETIHARRSDGTPGIMKVRIFSYDSENGVYFMLRSDITDIILEEEKRNQTLKDALDVAQRANRSKSDFLAAMSHDMRTPMNAIIGMTDIALSGHDPKQTEESLSVIKQSSAQLLHLINSILDMARIQRGKITQKNVTFRHSDEIVKLQERFLPLLEAKKLTLTHKTTVTHDLCTGDTEHIGRIIDNIVSNAIKYSREGGRVSCSMTELPDAKDGIAFYRVTVSDTGIGMTKEEIKHIFEPFYRGERAVSDGTEGSGLGLTIAKSMADLQGATIDVSSVPGKGTTFTLTFPLVIADSSAPDKTDVQKPAQKIPPLDGVSVLLIEDNEINTLVARKILENANMKVTSASNGKTGADIFRKSAPGTFDVILMDIRMPVMDGYGSTAAIRASGHPQAASIPIIAMTANAFAEDKQKCLRAGMNDHTAKPIDTRQLYETIAKWAGRSGR